MGSIKPIKVGDSTVRINKKIKIYGEVSKGDCPDENKECQTIVNQVRKHHPEIIMLHISNEGRRSKAQMDFAYSMGFVKGASDYLIVGNPMGLLEVKRKNYSHKLSKEQEDFLVKAHDKGAVVGMALGWEAGLEFIEDWKKLQK